MATRVSARTFYRVRNQFDLDLLFEEFDAFDGVGDERRFDSLINGSRDDDQTFLIAYDEDNYCITLDQFEHTYVGEPPLRSGSLNKPEPICA